MIHGEAISKAEKMIPSNFVTKDNPYYIKVRKGAYNMTTVKMALIQTDGVTIPKRLDLRCRSLVRVIVWSNDVVVTSRPGCKIHATINRFVAYRDALNAIHRHELTHEIMRGLPTDLRQALVKEVCLASL
jgi:hypothetical protein